MAEPLRVFISYSHDSAGHKLQVLELANSLRRDGIDARIDRYVSFPPEGWPRWMNREIEEADAVLVVCSEVYKERFAGTGQPGKGLGVRWEGLILTQALYDDLSENNAKVIPVLVGETLPSSIPAVLRPFSYFQIPNQYESLVRLLTDQPEVEVPQLGSLKRLPAKAAEYITDSLPVMSAGADEDIQNPLSDSRKSDFRPQTPSWAKRNERALEVLRERWSARRITLILGAGVSVGSGLPTWNTLINDLVASYVSRTYAGKLEEAAMSQINSALMNQFRATSPIQTAEFIRSRMTHDEFIDSMRTSLYQNYTDDLSGNPLLSTVVSLSSGLHGIVTFNFDDLVEGALRQSRVEFTAVIEGRDLARIRGIPVYHPHGFLPRSGEASSAIVFSESEYHTQYAQNSSWTNIVVQRLLLESTCLFVGTSLSDPNLRRIIDLAHRQNVEQRHFLLALAPQQSEEYVSNALSEIEQAAYEAIGITPLWFESYSDVPMLLDLVRS